MSVTPDATAAVMAENSFNDAPVADNQFFMAEIQATYRGSESASFWLDMSLSAVGPSSVAYDFQSSCGVIPNSITDIAEVFPGGTISGNECWSVTATDTTELVLIAEESLSFDDNRTFMALS